MKHAKQLTAIGFTLLIALMLLVGGVVLAQGSVLDAVNAILTQAENALNNEDLTTAQALFTGAKATITDEAVESCPALVGARSLLDEASIASDAAAAQAFLVSVRAVIEICSPGDDSPASDTGTTQDPSQQDEQQEGDAQTAQSFQQGSPGATAVPAAQDAPIDFPVITTANAAQLTELYRLGEGRLNQLSLSPDGSMVAAGGTAGVWLRDTADLNNPINLLLTEDAVDNDIAWSPDGSKIVAGYRSGLIQILDASSGDVLAELVDHTTAITQLDWSTDGRWLLSAGEDGVRMWNALDGTLHATVDTGAEVTYVSWSPDSSRFATADNGGHVNIYQGQTATLLMQLTHFIPEEHPTDFRGPGRQFVSTVEWSPDGTRLLSAATDGIIHVWDTTSWVETLTISEPVSGDVALPHWRVAWSPDGTKIAATIHLSSVFGGADISVWDAATGTKLHGFSKGKNMDLDLVWADDNNLIISGRTSMRKIQLSAGMIVSELQLLGPAHYGQVTAWRPDGEFFAVALNFPREVRVYAASNGETIRHLQTPYNIEIREVAWSPDGQYIAAATRNQIFVWETQVEWTMVAELSTGYYPEPRWTPDGRYLTAEVQTDSGNVASIWVTGSWEALPNTIPLGFSSYDFNAGSVITVRNLVDLVRYDIQTGQEIATYNIPYVEDMGLVEVTIPRVSPDGQWMASSLRESGQQELLLFHADDAQFGTLDSTFVASGYINSWSSDSRMLATISGASNAEMLNVYLRENGSLVTLIQLGYDPTYSINSWSPNGRYIILAGNDGFVHVYGVQP